MPKPARHPWGMISCALRGASIGLVVWGIFALSLDYADHAVGEAAAQTTTDLNGVEILGSIIVTALYIEVPASLVAGFALAWMLRLRRPWAVPLLGFLLSCLLFQVAELIIGNPMPGEAAAAVLALSFAGAALVPPNGRRTTPGEAAVGPSPQTLT